MRSVLVLVVTLAAMSPSGAVAEPLSGPGGLPSPSPARGWIRASVEEARVAHGVHVLGHLGGQEAGEVVLRIAHVGTRETRTVGRAGLAADGAIAGGFLVPEDLAPGRWWLEAVGPDGAVTRSARALVVSPQERWPLHVEPRVLHAGSTVVVHGGGFRVVSPHADVILLDATGVHRIRALGPVPVDQRAPHVFAGEVVLPGDVAPGRYRLQVEASAEERSVPVTVVPSPVELAPLPETVDRHERVQVVATGLPAGATAVAELVTPWSARTLLATALVDSDGRVEIDAAVPEEARSGPHWVRVRAGGAVGAADRVVTVVPRSGATLLVSPEPVARGDVLPVSASGLDGVETASIDLVEPSSHEVHRRLGAVPVVEGSLQSELVVPGHATPGRYRVVVSGGPQPLVSREVVTVTPGAGWAMEVPEAVPQGSRFPLRGRNLEAGETTQLRLVAPDRPDIVLLGLERVVQQGDGPEDPIEDPTIFTVARDGTLAEEVVLPTFVPPGTYGLALGAKGPVVGRLRVVSGDRLEIDPMSGGRGERVLITGRGLASLDGTARLRVEVVDDSGVDVLAPEPAGSSVLVEVSPDGTFSGSYSIPRHLHDGRYRLRLGVPVHGWDTTGPLLDVAGGSEARTDVAAAVRQGESVHVRSTGFEPATALVASLRTDAGRVLHLGSATVSGPFALDLAVPGIVPVGRHRLELLGTASGVAVGLIVRELEVQPGAAWAASSGPPVAQGGSATLAASGYGPGTREVTVTLVEQGSGYHVRRLGTLPVTAGTAEGMLAVPGTVPAGRYDVRWDADGDARLAHQPLEVVPGAAASVEVDAPQVPQGGSLTVRGRGFPEISPRTLAQLVPEAASVGGAGVAGAPLAPEGAAVTATIAVPRELEPGRYRVVVAAEPPVPGPVIEVVAGPPLGVELRADEEVAVGARLHVAGAGLPPDTVRASFALVDRSGQVAARLEAVDVVGGRFDTELIVPRYVSYGSHHLVVDTVTILPRRLPVRVVPDPVIPPPDLAPPVTTPSISPEAAASGWHTRRGGVRVDLSALDGATGSGVRGIWVEATGALASPRRLLPGGRHTLVVEAQGTTTFTFSAVDRAGNEEAEGTLVVRHDTERPVLDVRTPSFRWDRSVVLRSGTALDVRGTDATSGLASLDLMLSVDGGPRRRVAPDEVVEQPGLYVLEVSATDHAGLSTNVEVLPFVVVDPDGPGAVGRGSFPSGPDAYGFESDGAFHDVGRVDLSLSVHQEADDLRPRGRMTVVIPSRDERWTITDLAWAAVHGDQAAVSGFVDDPWRGRLQVTATVLRGRQGTPARARVQIEDDMGQRILDTQRGDAFEAPPEVEVASGSFRLPRR